MKATCENGVWTIIPSTSDADRLIRDLVARLGEKREVSTGDFSQANHSPPSGRALYMADAT